MFIGKYLSFDLTRRQKMSRNVRQISEQAAPSKLILRAVYDVSSSTPNRLTQVNRLTWERAEGTLEISYSGRRAVAFLRDSMDVERCIGSCNLKLFPIRQGVRATTQDGQPFFISVPSDLIASLEIDLYLCWTLGNSGVWQESKMELNADVRAINMLSGTGPGEYVTNVPLRPGDDAGVLYHYFRLVGHMDADRAKAVSRRRERTEYRGPCESETADHNWFYPEGERLGQVILFDNPYGPFSNYHF